jgi:saccharopine dehydrogenase-like NADP-dependent oxidoreductase
LSSRDILIAGGYGIVGQRLAADLAPDYPGRIVIAGRSQSHADEAAASIGYGVRSRCMDVTVPSSIAAALAGVAVVVSCIDQPGRALLWAAVERGLGYTDITPHLTELGRGQGYEKIDAAAKASGARLMLGTGIVPGISSVMVRRLADTVGGADEIETSLLLNAGDVSGPASFDYFLQELAMPFSIHVDGRDRTAHAFSAPRPVEYPPPVGTQPSYLFPFSDQVLYPRTMAARTVLTRLAIEPGWMSKVLSVVASTGIARLLANDTIRHTIAEQRKRAPSIKRAHFALRVDVRRGGKSGHATLVGHTQADAAAAGAAGVARALIEQEISEPGAWMPEQVIDPTPFLARLAAKGLTVQWPAA